MVRINLMGVSNIWGKKVSDWLGYELIKFTESKWLEIFIGLIIKRMIIILGNCNIKFIHCFQYTCFIEVQGDLIVAINS